MRYWSKNDTFSYSFPDNLHGDLETRGFFSKVTHVPKLFDGAKILPKGVTIMCWAQHHRR